MPEISNDGNYKQVTFKKAILVQTIPLYTRDIEDDPLWYSPVDYRRFKQRDRYIEQHMENPSIVTRIHIQSEMGDCTRGIDKQHPGAYGACAAVFREQQKQKGQNLSDPGLIAKAYSRVCFSSKRDALLAGARDEKYMREFNDISEISLKDPRENRQPCRRMRSWNSSRTLSDRKRDTVSYSSKSFRIPRSRSIDVEI
jgi:hypothetical protein